MNKDSPSGLYRLLIVIGGGALVGAMGIDTLAVLGRHSGIPLLGSIELVQVLVGITGALSMLVATVHGSHATVRILVSRLGQRGKEWLHTCNSLASMLFMLALTAGSLWLLQELWSSQEESELWHLPYRPLRVLICVATLSTAALFARSAWKGVGK